MDEAFVQQIVMQVMALLSKNGSNGQKSRKILIIFSGASTGVVSGLEAVGQLVGAGHQVTAVLTGSGRHLIGAERLAEAGAQRILGPDEWANSPILVRESDLLLVPTLSMNFAAHLALGLLDSLPTTLILGALLAGKPVVAIRDGADPDGMGGKVFGATPNGSAALRARLGGNLKTLASYGVELVSDAEFLAAVQRHLAEPHTIPASAWSAPRPAPQVLTQADVAEIGRGGLLRLPAGSRLTPLAQEMIAHNGIEVIFE